MSAQTNRILYVLCAIAFVVIVVRAYLNVKGPDAFVVTVSQPQVEAYARQQLEQLQARSFAEDIELCGIIFEDSDGELGSTRIIAGERASCDIIYFDQPGMARIASFHTHGSASFEYDDEVPSMLDLQSDMAAGMDGYVATPGGRFWHIDGLQGIVRLVCGPACLSQDRDYQPCPAFEPLQSYTLETLQQRSRMGGEC